MSLHRFKIFAVAAKHLNLSRASKELHISQPAISQHLKSLQDEFKIKLFEKNGRGIGLTPQGKTFRRDIDPILINYENLIKNYAAGERESLTLGGSSGPSRSLMPALMTQFSGRYPATALHLLTGTSHEIEDAIVNGKVDIGVVTEPFPSPLLIMEAYRTAKLVAFVSARHPVARKLKRSTAELAQFHIVIRVETNGQHRIDEALSRLSKGGIRPNNLISCESNAVLKSMVQKGAGIGFAYQDVIAEEVQAGKFKLLKLDADLNLQDYIVYNKQKPLSSPATAFLNLLRASRVKNGRASNVAGFKWAASTRALLILKALEFLADFNGDFVAGFLA